MIPLDTGLLTGATFGSSNELIRIQEIDTQNFKAYQSWFKNNPNIYQNDSIFVRLINLVLEYQRRELSIRNLIPNIAQQLELVYRNQYQSLHSTDMGNLVIIPVYEKGGELTTVLYSNATDLNYNRYMVIDTISIVTINIHTLESLLSKDDVLSINTLVTNEIMVPLHRKITDYAIFNNITGIDTLKKGGVPRHDFYMNDLNKFVFSRRKRISRAVSKLDTTPLDVLNSLPIKGVLKINYIEDDYIDNLLWINLLSYHMIVSGAGKINREGLYTKYERSYSLYKPRGRGDKYFGNASTELLDALEEINFI